MVGTNKGKVGKRKGASAGKVSGFTLKIPAALAKKLNALKIENSFRGPIDRYGMSILKNAVT